MYFFSFLNLPIQYAKAYFLPIGSPLSYNENCVGGAPSKPPFASNGPTVSSGPIQDGHHIHVSLYHFAHQPCKEQGQQEYVHILAIS